MMPLSLRTWIVGAAAALVLVVAAFAAAQPAAAAAKPKCVTVKHKSGIITQTTTVYNDCKKTVSFVVHRTGPDSPCVHAGAGGWRSYKWSNGLDYQGTSFGCD